MSELKTHMLKYHDVGEIMYVVECNNYKVNILKPSNCNASCLKPAIEFIFFIVRIKHKRKCIWIGI